ncbi:MAG: fibronectin type III domain-containing protein [Flavisolibacter sp.]|nr:fibronectin type III domain-containing protein [Flavisolibacter sp.]
MAQVRTTNGFEAMTDLEFLGKVRYIVSKMTGNANFPTTDPTLAFVISLADGFEQAINEADAGGSYDKLVRDSKKEELIETMHNLSDYVLFTAKGNRLVAESSGFTIAKLPSPQPPIGKPAGLSLSDGVNAGEILLMFKRVANARSYMYQISLDPEDETKWVSQHGTIRKSLFTGLQSGKRYYVRVVAFGTNGQVVYSDVVSRIAQ